MDEISDRLIDIRCPFKRKSKQDGNLYLCNRRCVRVTPGSAGEARCRDCQMNFEFSVDDNAQNSVGVRVQRL